MSKQMLSQSNPCVFFMRACTHYPTRRNMSDNSMGNFRLALPETFCKGLYSQIHKKLTFQRKKRAGNLFLGQSLDFILLYKNLLPFRKSVPTAY